MDERALLDDALNVACEAMRLDRADDATTYSTFEDSIGARVLDRGSLRWLRVYPQWDRENERQGWAASAAIPGVSKPIWYRCHDFEHAVRAMRADLLDVAPSPACTSELILTSRPPLGPEWFAEMRRSVDALARWPTQRVGVGTRPPDVERWVTSHTDMHWCNLTAPAFCLLDWDSWGLAPLGFGPATAYCAALLVPDVAEQVYATFRDQLETHDGRISLTIAANHLLNIIQNEGRYPEIARPLRDVLRASCVAPRAATSQQST